MQQLELRIAGELRATEPGRSITFGRDAGCDVVLDNRNVSRHHAELRWDDEGGWTIIDLGSTQGTFVNGQRITSYTVDGDVDVTLGVPAAGEVLSVRVAPDSEATSLPPAALAPPAPLPVRPAAVEPAVPAPPAPAHLPPPPAPIGVPVPVILVAPRTNGFAVTALVLGIIGALLALIPLLFFLGWILGVLAVVFGLTGRRRARRPDIASGSGMATTGFVLGAIAVVLGVIGLVILNNAVDSVTHALNTLDASEPCTTLFSEGKTVPAKWADDAQPCFKDSSQDSATLVISLDTRCHDGRRLVDNDYGWGYVGEAWHTDRSTEPDVIGC